MKTTFAAAAFAGLAAALPAPQAGTTTPLRFTALALHSASPIHFGDINANGQAFYIGKDTSTYCPDTDSTASTCATANTNQTIFSYLNSASTLFLSTIVPGGQQVYVTEGDDSIGQLAGQLKFTQAHSTATSGPAIYDGFVTVYDGELQFEGKDWFACAIDDFDSGYGIWAESRVEGENAGEGCIGFTWKLSQVDEDTSSAWQYTK